MVIKSYLNEYIIYFKNLEKILIEMIIINGE